MINLFISGLYEIVIGIIVVDENNLINYWENFGYIVNFFGNFDVEIGKKLYGVDFNLYFLCFYNKVINRSLVCFMIWDKFVNKGLELSFLKVVGSCWGIFLFLDVFNVVNYVEDG